jgi:glycogen synthase
MRVLVTTDVVGGVWDHTLILAGALAAAGDEVLVAMIGRPLPAQLAALPQGVEHAAIDLRLEWMMGGLADAAAGVAWLRGLVDAWRPDLLHLNQFAYAVAGFDVPVLVAAHSDVRSWWGEVRGADAPPEWHAYGEQVSAALRRADRVVAPSAYQSGLLARHYGRPADRVIPNGVPAVPAGAATVPASRRGGVLSAGRAWDAAKDVATLDRAAALLDGALPPVRLAGSLEGPDGACYRPVRLRALGQLSRARLDRLYADSAVLVATSLYEPFGLAPLEAAHAGCALLLSDIGSFRGLWNGAAEFFDAGNAAMLAHRLTSLLADPDRLDALAAAARARARERHTPETMAAGYRRVYGELVLGAATAPAGRAAAEAS